MADLVLSLPSITIPDAEVKSIKDRFKEAEDWQGLDPELPPLVMSEWIDENCSVGILYKIVQAVSKRMMTELSVVRPGGLDGL